MSGRDSESRGGSLPRADTKGESKVISRPPTESWRSAAATPRHLLTENGHHLAMGAAWRFDTAGGPKPIEARPKRPLKPGFTVSCKCGESYGVGPDPAVASDLAQSKCFNCRVRAVACNDRRGPNDPEACKDAIATIHRQDLNKRTKGGCDCDFPAGRLFNRAKGRPFGWLQGHAGHSRSQAGDWEGGDNRSEARTLKFNKMPWWERGPTPKATPGLMAPMISDQLGRLGGVRYYPCRSFVYAPTTMAHLKRNQVSNAIPDARLELDFVYGYNAGAIVGAPSTEFGIRMGSDVQDNLRWLDRRRIVYFAAATAIVYDIPLHTQRFFFGHDDAITCLALSPSRMLVATGQLGKFPKVFVWNPMSSPDPTDTPFKEAARRVLYKDIPAVLCFESVPPKRLFERKVTSLSFVNEETLVAIGGDDKNAFLVWDLATGQSIFTGAAGNTPVFLVRGISGWADSGGCQGNACARWSGELDYQKIKAVTTGAKHVGFWTLTQPSAEYPKGEWVQSKIEVGDNPLCVAFAMSATGETTELFTGQQDGSISNWVTNKLMYKIAKAHALGVTQVAWTAGGLLSGGLDCKLKVWRRKGAQLEQFPIKILDLKRFACSSRNEISKYLMPKSIDVLPEGQILLGTTSAQIFKLKPVNEWVVNDSNEVDANQCVTMLLDSHFRRQDDDDLHGLATYPVCGVVQGESDSVKRTRGEHFKNFFATCGPDHTWRMWNTKTRRPEFECCVEFKRPADGLVTCCTPSCIDIAPNGLLIAIGFVNGGWCIYMDVGTFAGASKYVDREVPAGNPIKQGWRQIYITDTSERDARLRELEKLENMLKVAKSDHYIGQHTNKRDVLKDQIQCKKEEMASKKDFASSTPISVIKFAPNGFWIVVGARDGKMGIFSLKNLEIQANPEGRNFKTNGSWIAISKLNLDHCDVHEEAFLDEESEVTELKYMERLERAAAREVIPGELHLKGMRGEIRKLGQCSGHGTAVTHCDWSLDCRHLRSTSDTWELLFWDTPRGTQNEHPDQCCDVVWASHTVNFGWPLQGIWSVESDGSFVYAVDVSRGNGEVKVCATGDSLGHVKLFAYPCVGEQPMFKSFIGHASHVKSLTFTQDNKYIISLGGNDCSVFQWRYIPKFPDTLLTPKNDVDLLAVTTKPSRFEVQLQRRVNALESNVTVRLVIDGDPKEVDSRPIFFREKLRLEISKMLDMIEDRLQVDLTLSPLIIADVTFRASDGASDFATPKQCALDLMKIVEGAHLKGLSLEYLLVNKISSATLLTDAQFVDKGAHSKEKVINFDKTEAHSTDVGFCVKLSTEWQEVEVPGLFGEDVLREIARAAGQNKKLRVRAGIQGDDIQSDLALKRFFQVKSVHRERDSLEIDMKFINDPDGLTLHCEDISGMVIAELSSQINDEGSTLKKGKRTQAVTSIMIIGDRELASLIPLRLELERALGYNGGRTCCNMQMLVSFGNIGDNVSIMYTSGNIIVMENVKKSNRLPAQRYFCKHAEDISCIAVHPNGYSVVSGDSGPEPTLIFWNSDTLAEISRIAAFTQELTALEHDYIGKTQLLLTVDALSTHGAINHSEYVGAKIYVTDAKDGGILKGVFLKIDKEIMLVENANGNLLICKRACQGTLASRHATGSTVLVFQPTFKHELSGGIAALAFTRFDFGKRIVCVSADVDHTILVFDVASGTRVGKGDAGKDTILAVGTHPKEDVIVTCGVDHIKFWHVAGVGLRPSLPNFGSLGRNQTFLCVDFCYMQYQGYGGETWSEGCPGGIVTLTGSADGYIYLWEHNLLRKIVNMAHTGPIFDLFVPDTAEAVVLTAGQDGFIRMWNLNDETEQPQVLLADDRMMAEFNIEFLVRKDGLGRFAPKSRSSWSLRNVRSYGDSIYVGTGANEIYELAFERVGVKYDEYGLHPEPTIIARTAGCGLQVGGSVISLVCHPNKLECVTVASGGLVRRWNLDSQRQILPMAGLLAALAIKTSRYSTLDCVCVDYHPSGGHLAIGLNNGRVMFVDSSYLNHDDRDLSDIYPDGSSRGRVRVVKFSPDIVNVSLAVLGENGKIDLVDFTNRKVLASVTCNNIPGVPSLDWTLDARTLVTNAINASHPKSTWTQNWGDPIEVISHDEAVGLFGHLASWTSTRGRAVSGLHAEDGIATGVTCTQRFPNTRNVSDQIQGKVVLFGDDFGKVNVSNFPNQMETNLMECDRATAHAGPVACVAFSYDGKFAVSVGSNDLCLLVWRVIYVPNERLAISDHLDSILQKYRSCNADAPEPISKSNEGQDVISRVPDYYVGLVCPVEHAKKPVLEGVQSLPEEQLKLTRCYSYRGFDTRGNAGILPQSGHIVYFTAGLAIVQNCQRYEQRFFTNHRHNISCIAVHPKQDFVVTGDVASAHKGSCVWVWDAGRLEHSIDKMDWESRMAVKIQLKEFEEGVASVCFCDVSKHETSQTSKIAILSLKGRLLICQWQEVQSIVSQVQTEDDLTRPVLAVCSDLKNQFVTCGSEHLKFWSLSGRSFVCNNYNFGLLAGVNQVFICSKYVDSGLVVTGTQEGSIYVWTKDGTLIHIVQKDQAHMDCEVFDLCVPPIDLATSVFHVLSGGADRRAIVWEFRLNDDGNLFHKKLFHKKMHAEYGSEETDSIRSVVMVQDKIVIGTARNGLYLHAMEASSNSSVWDTGSFPVASVLSAGHYEGKVKEGRINCVCCSPDSSLFATGGSDETVILWDGRLGSPVETLRCALLHTLECIATPVAMDWGPAECAAKCWVAVVFKTGNTNILEVEQGKSLKVKAHIQGKGSGASVRFSPDANFLAVGRRSGRLDFYGGGGGEFALLKSFSAHSGPCCAVDWALGLGHFFVRSNSYLPEELLFWHVPTAAKETGKEAKEGDQSIKQVKRMKDLVRCQWVKQVCRISWFSQGLIKGQEDHPDPENVFRPNEYIACCASSPLPDAKHLACGCDDSVVRLFAAPCLSTRALGRPYYGHAARISALAYSSTSNFIVSVSANMAILQWECKIFTKVSGKARVEDEYDPCEDEIQKLFSEFQKEIKRAPAIDGVKDYTDAVHKLDEAFELIRLSVVAQDWDQKFLGLANGMIKSVLEQLENLSKEISERLDRGEISRVGFPVERYLERIKSVAMLFASLTRFSSDLQSGVEDIKKMKAKADQFEASMRQVLIKLNEGFRLITEAEAHLSTLGGHSENIAKDLDTPKPPTPTILARILQSCKRCREEEGEVQKNLTEARKIALKGFRDEFVKTIDVAARMLDDAMLELKVVETLHNLSSGQQQADQDAQLRALRDLEKLIGLLKENNHTGKLVKRHAHTMMKQAKKPQTQHSGGDHYSDDEHDVDDESPPHVQAGRPRVAPPDDSDGAGAKARGAPKPTEDSMEEEGVEDWEPEDLDESVDSQQAKGEAGRPRVAPSLGDSDGEPINSDVEDE